MSDYDGKASDRLRAATLAATRREAEEGTVGREAEKAALERQRRDDEAELRRLVGARRENGRPGWRTFKFGATERRLSEIGTELAALANATIEHGEVATALAEFDGVWGALSPREQARVLELLIKQVTYDGKQRDVSITFRPTAIKALAVELADHEECAA